jgi:membrane-associated phospholipid phosphatase
MKSRLAGIGAVAALVVVWGTLPCAAEDVEALPAAVPTVGELPTTPATPPPTLAGPSVPALTDAKPLSLDGFEGDGRRTMADFPKNLGRNLIGVFSRQNLIPFAMGVALTGTSSQFDARANHVLAGSCISCGSTGATAGGAAVVPFVGALFLAGRVSPQGRFRAMTYDFTQALIVTEAYTGLLKYTVQRPRPDGTDNLSFPSGHTSAAFSLATVAEQHYGWKIGVPAYLVASGIGLSRVESSKHNLSDVLAGATIGVIVGRTVARRDGDRPAKKSTFAITPQTDAEGGGVGVGVAASW